MNNRFRLSVLTLFAAFAATLSVSAQSVPSNTSVVTIVAPSAGSTLSGTVIVVGQIGVNLDAAGSYLLVDGVQFGTSRVSQGPYTYTLDTTKLSNGAHALQIWAHDTNNSTDISAVVSVTVNNSGSSAPPVVVPPVTAPVTSSGTTGTAGTPIPMNPGQVNTITLANFAVVPGATASLVFTAPANGMPVQQMIAGEALSGVTFDLIINGQTMNCTAGQVITNGSPALTCTVPATQP